MGGQFYTALKPNEKPDLGHKLLSSTPELNSTRLQVVEPLAEHRRGVRSRSMAKPRSTPKLRPTDQLWKDVPRATPAKKHTFSFKTVARRSLPRRFGPAGFVNGAEQYIDQSGVKIHISAAQPIPFHSASRAHTRHHNGKVVNLSHDINAHSRNAGRAARVAALEQDARLDSEPRANASRPDLAH